MNVYEGLKIPPQSKKTIVSVGSFDGVHLGHKALINRLKDVGEQYNSKTILVTFDLPPRFVLSQNKQFKLLNTLDEKLSSFKNAGIDSVWIIPFTNELAELSHNRFVEEYLAGRAGVGHLVIGYDHSFGKEKKGNYHDLLRLSHQLGFSIEQVAAYKIEGTIVSSSHIRELLLDGNLVAANRMLGYLFRLNGRVVRGNQIGKLIGFPTANLSLSDPNKLIPSTGVYACLVEWRNQTFYGMSNIGFRPTLNAHQLTIEAHIFDFDQDIYNDTITLKLVQKIRNEIKFGSLQLLKKQLYTDQRTIKELFKNQPPPT